jgi:hypothetical protein
LGSVDVSCPQQVGPAEQAEKYNNYQYSQGDDKITTLPILFGIITIATFGSRGLLLDEVINLVIGKNYWSILTSSLDVVEIYWCSYFGSDQVQVS